MIKAPISLQDLRRRLYVKAKAEPSWRFWGLYVHVCKRETLREAYQLAKENDGAPGIDGVTFEAIEAEGVGGVSRPASRGAGAADVSTPAGTEGGDTEGRRQDAPAFDSIDPGPGGPGGAEADPGTDLRGGLPTGVVWLPAEEVSARCDPARFGGDPGGQDLRHRFGSAILLRHGATSHRAGEGGAASRR